jgi:hypothetical protein
MEVSVFVNIKKCFDYLFDPWSTKYEQIFTTSYLGMALSFLLTAAPARTWTSVATTLASATAVSVQTPSAATDAHALRDS